MTDELGEKLGEWVRKGGIPLEYEAARAMAAVGFDVQQGRGYETEYDGRRLYREIDALGTLGEGATPLVHLVLECKHTGKGQPWLVMTNDRVMSADETLRCLVAGRLASEALLWSGERSAYRRGFPAFLGAIERPGFAAVAAVDLSADRPADRDERNLAREALAQAVGAARAMASDRSGWHLAWPAVVISAPLYRLSYGSEQGEITRVERQRVLWYASPYGAPTAVDLVTVGGLPAYVADAHVALSLSLRRLQDSEARWRSDENLDLHGHPISPANWE